MQCPLRSKDGQEILIAYVAGTLSPEVAFAVEQHITLCSACCALAERQRELWAALDVWSSTPVPPDFNDRLYARIAAEKNPWWRQWTQARWPGGWRPALPVAFACAALLTAFLLKEPPAQNDATSPALEAPQIEQVERALDDVEMLKQLGLTPARANSSREEI